MKLVQNMIRETTGPPYTQAPVLTCLANDQSGPQEIWLESGGFSYLRIITSTVLQDNLDLMRNGVNNIPKFAVWVQIYSPVSQVWIPVLAIVDPSMHASFIERSRVRSFSLVESLNKARAWVSPDWSYSLAPGGKATDDGSRVEVDFSVGNDGVLNKEYDVGLGWDYYWPLVSSMC